MGHLLRKKINSSEELKIFSKCSSFTQLLHFIKRLAASIENTSNSEVHVTSKFVSIFSSFLKSSEVELEMKNYTNSSRYGNPLFRDWLISMQSMSFAIINEFLDYESDSAEVNEYFISSLGDTSRLDYGTCNELHFICFLFCLFKKNLVIESDFTSLVLILYIDYWNFVKTIQKKFLLEPAGSLGVWGLDDYNFLPFLFGSSQLSAHNYLKPCSVRNFDILKEFSGKYLYFDAILNVSQAGIPLADRSPILNDITASKSWSKVYKGLLKTYELNVLGKIQIMQHFLFGKIIDFDFGDSTLQTFNCNPNLNVHGDCCGNRLPAIFNSNISKRDYTLPFD